MRIPGILLALAAAGFGAEESVVVRLEEKDGVASRPGVAFPEARFLLLREKPPQVKRIPALSPEARYGAARLGPRTLLFALDAPPGSTALGLLYADRAGNGVLAPEPVRATARPAGDPGDFDIAFDNVEFGALRANVRLAYRHGRVEGGWLFPARHRRGRAAIAGQVREVILVDGDGDGAWNGAADRWIAFRVETAAKIATLRLPETLLLAEPQVPFEEDGRAFSVREVAKDGSSLRLVLGAPVLEMRAVLTRREAEVRALHFARFDEEREEFTRAQGLDAKRPRAAQRAPWQSIPFSGAKELAAREGRPLLVFYTSESNAWCYRVEYYTFADREVDELLRKFVLVRIDAEKDPEQSYGKSGARGFPAFLPLSASGAAPTFSLLVREADGKTRELAGEKCITGWQRPQEFAENLRRILRALGQ